MKKINLIFLALFLFHVFCFQAEAAGVSVHPDKLNYIMEAKTEITKSIVVENISDRPVIYNLYVDEMEDQLFLAPANFRLEVGEKRQVKIKASPAYSGVFATNLSIVTQDLDRRTFNVATGVKVPIVLQVSPASVFILPAWLEKNSFILMIPLIILATYLMVLLRRKKHWWEKIINIFKKK